MSLDQIHPRSYLYAPGFRPDRMAKAIASEADAVVLDLEDAVAPNEKADARRNVADLLGRLDGHPPCAIQVRVNRTVSGAYDVDDLRAVVVPGLEGVRVPKAENAAEIAALSEVVEAAESESGVAPGSVRLYPIVESALGVLGVGEIARACPRVVRFCFGSTDFLGDIGAGGSDSHDPTLVARSTIVLHGRAAGCAPPVDSVYTTVADLDGLRAEAIWARDLGFFGKSVIHPCQIAPVHEVFSPSPDAVATAQSIVDAFADAGEGAIVVDGLFVDAAVAARAHALLRAARREDER